MYFTGKAGIAMAVMDEFKQERESLKNAGFKKKLSYFTYYYKWHVIAGILVILGVASIIYEMATHKDTAFYAVMMNATEIEEPAAEFNGGFLEYAGIDTNEYETIFDTSIRVDNTNAGLSDVTVTSTEKLMVYVAAAEIDVMVTDSASIEKYANSSSFYDLRDILSEEQAALYEPYFYYVDFEDVRALEEAQSNLDDTYKPVFDDPAKPEDMAEPVPVGLYINNAKLQEAYYFRGEDVVVSVYSNTRHLDAALKYIDFLMQ